LLVAFALAPLKLDEWWPRRRLVRAAAPVPPPRARPVRKMRWGKQKNVAQFPLALREKEESGSSSYVLPDPDKDTQLQYALKLLRDAQTAPAHRKRAQRRNGRRAK